MRITFIQPYLSKKSLIQFGLPVIAYVLLAGFLASLLVVHLNNQVAIKTTNNAPKMEEKNLNVISSWHLFGLNPTTQFKKVRDSSIELVGIIYKDKDSSAIMRVNSKEDLFKNGDKIDGYTIQKIEKSRVLVATNEGIEEIELFSKLNGADQINAIGNTSEQPNLAPNPSRQPDFNSASHYQNGQNILESLRHGMFRGNTRGRN